MEGVYPAELSDCMDGIEFVLPDTISLDAFATSETHPAVDATSATALDDTMHAHVIDDTEFPCYTASDEISPNVTLFLGIQDSQVFQGAPHGLFTTEDNKSLAPANTPIAESCRTVAVGLDTIDEEVHGAVDAIIVTDNTVNVHPLEVTEPAYKRPRRAAAIAAEVRVREVLEWEKCKESSHKFKSIASHMNEEFDRVARGEVSYRKRTSNKFAMQNNNGSMTLPGPSSSAYPFVCSDDEGNADADDNDDDDAEMDDDDDVESLSSFVVDDSCEIETTGKPTDSFESEDDEGSNSSNASIDVDSEDDGEEDQGDDDLEESEAASSDVSDEGL